ncbi:Fructokinase [Thalassoporum mexicanum PCC 7367]|uniref:carbohydrate kinase family protein n=1 Tax=Thalassoporum mexicanum TaxID=3457544 RepID=UPI00029F96BB|nr:carbohydrate kinase [Pseudanabaena sp. PCC 7367]AFY68646.1 Fructokinase [Pseudanabaena sp. PCC 7367]
MPRIICLGEILVDQIANYAQLGQDQVLSWQAYPGGSPANIACAIARLGESCALISCIGNDQIGQDLLAEIKQKGVDPTGIQINPTARTREVYVSRDAKGDRRFINFSGTGSTAFADTKLQADQLPIELFEAADFLVLGTLALAQTDSMAAVKRAIELAEQNYLRVVVDVNWRPLFWDNADRAPDLIYDLLEHADFLKLSADEAEWLFHTSDPTEIGNKLEHLEAVLVTDGEHGCRYRISDRTAQFGGFRVNAIDTTGAGDAFVAGFVYQLCQHKLQELNQPEISDRIVRYACAVGAISTQSIGAMSNLPSHNQVQDFLTQQQA